MKTMLLILTIISDLSFNARAEINCDLLISKKGETYPAKIPLEVLREELAGEAYFSGDYENITAYVILSDDKNEASLKIDNMTFNSDLKFNTYKDIESASIRVFVQDTKNPREVPLFIDLSCNKKLSNVNKVENKEKTSTNIKTETGHIE